jgi:hypothetical protein
MRFAHDRVRGSREKNEIKKYIKLRHTFCYSGLPTSGSRAVGRKMKL